MELNYSDDSKKVIIFVLKIMLLAVLGAFCRIILSEDKHCLIAYVRGGVLSVFAAFLVGMSLTATGLGPGLQHCLIGLASFIADDLLLAIRRAGKNMVKDPLGVVERVMNVVRGK